MKITPCPHGLEDVIAQQPGYVRGSGVHMSELYGALYQDLEPGRYTGGTPDPLMLEAGLTLESIVEEGLKKRLIERPGEFVEPEHGIIFSPDLIIFNHHVRVGEIKLTWLSSRETPSEPGGQFPPKFAKYITQMACYCRCLETPYARLIGFFVNGDYAFLRKGEKGKGPSPQLLAWDLTFTKRELDEEWNSVINFAKFKGLLK